MTTRPRHFAYFASTALVVGGTLLGASLLPQPWGGMALTAGALLCVAVDRVWSRARGPVFPSPLTAAVRVYLAVLAAVLVSALMVVTVLAPGSSGWPALASTIVAMATVLAGSWVAANQTPVANPSPEE